MVFPRVAEHFATVGLATSSAANVNQCLSIHSNNSRGSSNVRFSEFQQHIQVPVLLDETNSDANELNKKWLDAIVDIIIVYGSESIPPGFTKIGKFLTNVRVRFFYIFRSRHRSYSYRMSQVGKGAGGRL